MRREVTRRSRAAVTCVSESKQNHVCLPLADHWHRNHGRAGLDCHMDGEASPGADSMPEPLRPAAAAVRGAAATRRDRHDGGSRGERRRQADASAGAADGVRKADRAGGVMPVMAGRAGAAAGRRRPAGANGGDVTAAFSGDSTKPARQSRPHVAAARLGPKGPGLTVPVSRGADANRGGDSEICFRPRLLCGPGSGHDTARERASRPTGPLGPARLGPARLVWPCAAAAAWQT